MKNRLIYDDDYYILKTVLVAPNFEGLKEGFYMHLEQQGIPVPGEGFTDKTKRFSYKFFNRYTLETKASEILSYFGIENNPTLISALLDALLRRTDKINGVTLPSIEITPIKESKKHNALTFQVFFDENIKKEDLEYLWLRIEEYLYKIKKLPRKRNKEWEEFVSDKAVYELSILATKKLENVSSTNTGKNRALPDMMRDLKEIQHLSVHLSSEDSTIYKSINRYSDFLKRTGLKNTL